MRLFTTAVAVVVLACAGPVFAQEATARATAPEIPYTSVPNWYTLPPGLYMGEGIGVSTNSRGHTFIMTRSEESRVFEFDHNGDFVKEFGKGSYAFAFAHSVRVDSVDNVWTVDEGTNMVVKFSPEGRILMVLGKRPEVIDQLASMPGTAPYSGSNRPYSFHRPTDVAFDPQGNIFISDGYTDSRVVKYDKDGRFIRSFGVQGSGVNQLNLPHTIAVDARGRVYVGDRSNSRIVVLDNDLNWVTEYNHVGAPWGICISQGEHQYLFTANAVGTGVDAASRMRTGEIYKLELDGTVVGRFGRGGTALGEFASTHMISCKNPGEVYVSEIQGWRVQKILLNPRGAAQDR